MIKIENLAVQFGEDVILDGVNLQINQGEITQILGQSGSGKSVLMKTVEGLHQPSKGRVEIDGTNIFKLNRKELNNFRTRLAMLFQGAALLDSLNVFQNVALPLKEHTSKKDDEILEIVKSNLELVGLTDILEKMPSELSGGMKKRVALARAISLNPEYIIYDEPTTGLDPLMADEIAELILKMHEKKKITTIVITHDQNCIEKLKGNIALIHDKKILFDGSYNEFKNADNKIVRSFLK